MGTMTRYGAPEQDYSSSSMSPPASQCGHTLNPSLNGPFNNRRSTGTRISCKQVISGTQMTLSVLKIQVPPPLSSPEMRMSLIVARKTIAPKKVERLPFVTKYIELQRAMFYHNNALTSSHPYASQPISWPFLLRGVSFWTKGDEIRQQIYFIGNPVGWWIAVAYLAIFTGILSADQITRRRGIESIEERIASTLPD